jgi:cysteine synthase A
MGYATSFLDLIGKTPLLALEGDAAGARAQGGEATQGAARRPIILGKIEYFSPSGSLKDRIYREMITRAEERGDLRPGMRIIECSTGNAGIACSFVGALKGYPVTIVMPAGMSEERKKLIRAYGAEIVETPGGESDVDLALARLGEIKSASPGLYWEAGQFVNEDNVRAHYNTTGPEIWEASDGEVDVFVASQGTGGTITGVGRYLRERNPKVRLYAVEPAECPILSERRWGPHAIEGIGDGFVPRNLDLSILTGIVTTTSDEAIDAARELARRGVFCGISSGCNFAAARKLARHLDGNGVRAIVTMINDTGQRYFSTALCGEAKHVEIPDREHPIDDYTREQLDKYQGGWDIVR